VIQLRVRFSYNAIVASSFEHPATGRCRTYPTLSRRYQAYDAAMAKLRIGVLVVAAMVTSLVGAVPAQSDNASNFLAKVSEHGLNVGDTPADMQATLATGTEICQLLHYGYTPQVAGQQLPYVFPNATPEQIAGFVEAAQRYLCPQMETPLQPGGDY
jgi:hypothetical protein